MDARIFCFLCLTLRNDHENQRAHLAVKLHRVPQENLAVNLLTTTRSPTRRNQSIDKSQQPSDRNSSKRKHRSRDRKNQSRYELRVLFDELGRSATGRSLFWPAQVNVLNFNKGPIRADLASRFRIYSYYLLTFSRPVSISLRMRTKSEYMVRKLRRWKRAD